MAERRFTVRLDAEMNISQVKGAVSTMQTELSKLNLPQDVGSKLTGTFDKLTAEIERFQAMSAKGIGSKQEFDQIASSGNKILQLYEQLSGQVKNLNGMSNGQLSKWFPPQATANIKKAQGYMQQYNKAIKTSEDQAFKLGRELDTAKTKTTELKNAKQQLESKRVVTEKTFAGYVSGADRAKAKFEEAKVKLEELKNSGESEGKAGAIANQEQEVQRLEIAWQKLENRKKKAMTQSQKDAALAQLVADIQTAEGDIVKLQGQLNNLKIKDEGSFQQLIAQLNQINGINLDPTTATVEQVQQAVTRLSQQELEKLRASFAKAGIQVNGTRGQFQGFQSQIDQTRTKVNQLDNAMGEVDMLKSRIQYFFGITNAVYLLRRALTSAFETVKELDEQMVQTAVVTDFSVSDMWEKLPQYTKAASALGAKVVDLYGATTLYYQQGLKSNEAMKLGVETMKMGRIAGMESAEATEAMTAALRGFNMELTELSATRINDVYSKLAAITAADTEQIATAMTKTASIASSANMEFETTAALLAQIIETTQEAPETAGTAMKTIIARFTEVKELFKQGQLTGEDSEGEEININRIDTALRSAGISLKDFLNGTKGIDKIFLELAEKWDTLDLATQRYIATMAAGSRQQSRFLAMMGNYDRTMELVDAANNSAGASQAQFEKTTEGLTASLNELKNAWDEFLMGLANESVIKDVVDLLTKLLNLINWLTSAGGNASGAGTLAMRLGFTVVAFKGIKALVNKGLASIVDSFGTAGTTAGGRFWGAFSVTGMTKKQMVGMTTSLTQFNTLWGVSGQNFANSWTAAVGTATQGTTEWSNALHTVKNQYNLTDAEVLSFNQHLKDGGDASGWATQHYNTQTNSLRLQEEQLRRNNQAQLKSIATMAGIIIAIYAIVKAMEYSKKAIDERYETATEKMEDLKKVEEELVNQTKELSDELSNIGNKKNHFREMTKEMERLKKGTAEWAANLHESRTQMLDIITKYPELKNAATTINGMPTLTEAGWEQYEQLLMKDYYDAMIAMYANKIGQNEIEKIQKVENLSLPTNTVTAAEEKAIQDGRSTGNLVGGAIGGIGGYIGGTALAAGAAKALGVVGTAIAPGVGTIIGAVVGLVLGGLLGSLFGGKTTADDGIDPNTVNSVAIAAGKTWTEKDVNGNDIVHEGFIAEGSSQGEIEAFLSSQKLTTEEFNQLSDYIAHNAEEFDKHTQAMQFAQDQLIQYGRQIGAIEAESKGYTGETANAYEDVSAYVYGTGWSEEYQRQAALIGDTVTAERINEITSKKLGGYVSYLFEEGKHTFTNVSGQKNVLSDEQILDLIIGERTSSVLNERTDIIYNFMAAQDRDSSIIQAGLLGSDTDFSTFSYNQLADKEVWDNIEKESGQLQWLQDQGRTKEDYAREAAAKGYTTKMGKETRGMDYTISYDEYETYDERYAGWLGGGKTGFVRAKKDEKGGLVSRNVEKTLSAEELKLGNDQEIANKKTKNFHVTSGAHGNYTTTESENEARNLQVVSWDENVLSQYMLETYGINPLAWTQYYDEEKTVESTYDISGAQEYIAGLEGIFGENGRLDFLSDVAIGTVLELDENIQQLSITHRLDANKIFYDPLEKIWDTMGNMTEDQRNVLMNIITTTDITDLTDLRKLQSTAKKMEGVSEETATAIDEYVEGIEKTGVAIAKIDLETLTNQLRSAFDLLKKIEDVDLGEVTYFTEEEVNSLIASDITGSLSMKDFYSTSDGFVYLGESMDELRDTIMTSNEILLGMQVNALQKKVNVGKFIEGNKGLKNMSWETVSSWGPEKIAEFVTYSTQEAAIQAHRDKAYSEAIAAGKDEEEAEAARQAAESSARADPSILTDYYDKIFSGEVSLQGTPLEGLDLKLIEDLWNTTGEDSEIDPEAVMNKYGVTVEGFVYSVLGEVADAALNFGTYNSQLENGIISLKQENLSHMTGQEMIDAIGTTDSQGNTYTKEEVDEALRVQGQIEGTTIAGYELGQQIYQDTGGADLKTEEERNAAWEEAHRLGQALALDAAKNQKEYNELTKIFDEHADTVTKTNRKTDAYRKGLSKIQAAMEDAYNIKLSEQFMLDHADILERVLAGEEGAWEEWANLMAEETARGMNMSMEHAVAGASALAIEIDNIANTISPTIGVTTTFDGEGIKNAELGLQELGGKVVATQDQLNSMAALYDILGATINFDTTTGWMVQGQMVIAKTRPENASSGPYTVVKGVTVKNTGGLNNYSPSGGGGGGGSESWENPYDEFYNTVEKINEELRKREKLELRYQRLLDRNAATAAEIVKLTREQLASLDIERADREGLLQGRKRQMNDIMSEYSDVGKYAKYNEETGQIEINWDLLEALDGSTDEELTSRVEEFISKLEEQQDLIEEEEDALEGIQDAIWAIYEQGKDEYFDLEERIKDAIIADRQKEIDELSAINESINDTNSKLLDSMQEQLDEYRQNRDNEKTEEELSDKQRRLAYLQQDTSGANALEIMQLQKELDEATEDYTDTLIDQKISELQQQNDEAAEQRQQQIDLQQAILDKDIETGALWQQVSDLMEEGLDPETGIVRGSTLEQLLMSADGFEGMSHLKKMDWMNELNNDVAQALAWLQAGAMQNLYGQGEEVKFKDKDGNDVTGKINENGDVETDDGRIYDGSKFKMDPDGNLVSEETEDEAKKNWEDAQPKVEPPKGKLSSLPAKALSGKQVKDLQEGLNKLREDGIISFDKALVEDGIYGQKTKTALKALQELLGVTKDGIWGKQTANAFKARADLTAYKTGGLADFTGPAWLDGTKSRPEYILNADQTKAFFSLIDVLGSLQSGNSKTAQNSGDNTYDIDINVESIGSDYDVEQLADTIKRLINEDARYRNNNTINLMR